MECIYCRIVPVILEIQQFGFKKKVLLFELDFIRALYTFVSKCGMPQMGNWALKHGTDFASNFETISLNFHPTADIMYSRNRWPCYKLPIVVPPIILGIAALVIFFFVLLFAPD